MSYKKRVIIFISIITVALILLLVLFYLNTRGMLSGIGSFGSENNPIIPEEAQEEFRENFQELQYIED